MSENVSLKVLVVDDTLSNRKILEAFLAKNGHVSIMAEDGAIAIERFKEQRPDLVLMDIMMPVMDGFEATRKIKELAGDTWVPVIVLSALSSTDDVVKGLEAGADDYLSKPINFVVLNAKIRSIQRSLEMQRRVDEARRRAAAIAENVIDAVITINAEGLIESCNPATEMLFGYTQDELPGQNVSVLMPEPHCSQHDDYIRRYLMGGEPHVIGYYREVLARRKDGATFPCRVGVSEFRLDNQRYFLGVLSDLTERKRAETLIRENAERLERYYKASETENALARGVMERQMHRPGLRDPHVTFWLTPAQSFSGDLLAAARGPQGRLYGLLADATGHGLAAAICALPVLNSFYSKAQRGSPLARMIGEMNDQLREAMPTGRFVGAALFCVDESARKGEIWVGGMPEVLQIDKEGHVSARFASSHLPLGIVKSTEMPITTTEFSWNRGDQLLMCSDGVLEASSPEDEHFGTGRIESTMTAHPPAKRAQALRQALANHTQGKPLQDDVSLLLISLD